MKFMVSMITDESRSAGPTPEEMKQMGEKMGRFMEELGESGALADPGSKLGPSAEATTLRYGADGEVVVTDGPFAESKEQIAGYMVLECDDLGEAVGWARKMPVTWGSIEVRPIAQMPDGS